MNFEPVVFQVFDLNKPTSKIIYEMYGLMFFQTREWVTGKNIYNIKSFIKEKIYEL